MELALFALLALVAIVSAAFMIYSRNSVHSALFLILNFGCVALLFLMLDAPFISMVQIAVYAGAIMVLFLFVIMLLGAEQTTDTEAHRLGWLPAASTILAAALLGALGLGMLWAGNLDLPESPGETPRLRIVHAGNADLITVSVDGQPLDDLYFGENSEFFPIESTDEVPAVGEHLISLTDEEGNVLLEGRYTLDYGDAKTLVVTGNESLSILEVDNSFATTAEDEARLVFLNLYTEEALALVDLGTDRLLNTNGSTILDRVITPTIPYGEVFIPVESNGNPVVFKEGEYSYGIYRQLPDGSWDDVLMLNNPTTGNWRVEAGTEQTIIITPDYNAVGNRPMIVDALQESLVFETNDAFGSPRDMGRDLFTTYLLPVNVVGFLLLVALVGVIVLTRPEILAAPRRSSINRRRKVSRPLVNVISQQTGQDVVVETPKLEDPATGE